jgi:hypothetical protein
VLDDPLRDTWLGQLDDLTGRPGVDITEDAFADLLSQRSLHAVLRRAEEILAEETPAASKKEPLPSRGRRTL